MQYKNTIQGIFEDRPNRFIAHVWVEGVLETVHVKNTGRCRELLLPGVPVILEIADNPDRKTKYDLIAVKKENLGWVNIDSQAPNKIAAEWLAEQDFSFVKPEYTYGKSRVDFYMERGEERYLMEVKGCTLEIDGVGYFPDAPTERGVKHLHELTQAVQEGYHCAIAFVIPMEGVTEVRPNRETHPAFGEALDAARAAGVEMILIPCRVWEDRVEHLADPFSYENMIVPLLKWYRENARSLPWRETRDAYHIWVSEIMLQQTRVEAVKPYYARFLQELPTIRDLAECEEDRLLKLWEGLGYYSRVRNMQTAAKTVMEEYGGALPADYDKLLALKGIGGYTAGAIASAAFGIPAPAVDGNVLRVIMRLTADDSDILKQSTKKKVEQMLKPLMHAGEEAIFNQALMELGATVCVPNGEPLCGECPWRQICEAKKRDLWRVLPVKKKAKERRIEERTVLIIRDEEKIVLHKRPDRGLLAGLYEFPNVEGHLSSDEALKQVRDMGVQPLHIQPLEDAKHIFSHVEWHMKGYMVRVDSLTREESDLLFVEADDSEKNYPIPSAFAAYTKYMNIRLGVKEF